MPAGTTAKAPPRPTGAPPARVRYAAQNRGAAETAADGTTGPAPIQRRAPLLIAVIAAAATVGLMYHRVFGSVEVLVPTVVAAVVPVALAAVMRDLRAPAAVSVAAGTVAAALIGSAVYAGEHAIARVIPTPRSLATLFDALTDAPREILTSVLPSPPSSGSVVLVPACVWIASAAGAEVVLRTRFPLLALLPAALLLVGAALLATGAPGASLPLIAAFAVVSGVFFALRDPTRTSGDIALAGLLALALAAPAVLVAPVLPGASRHAFDPRGNVDPPTPRTVRGPNPLAYVSAWLQNPQTPLFTDSGARPDANGRLYRLAAFDRYDGVSWTPIDRFVPSGGRVPEASEGDGGGTGGDAVRQFITVEELPGVFLPAVDRPVQVRVPDGRVAVDPASGVLAWGAPLRAGMTYEVTSSPVEQDPRRTEYTAAGHAAEALALPDHDASGSALPAVDELRAYAQEATAGATFPYQQALRLASWLRERAVNDPLAVPGHSYRNIQYFLGTSHHGTSEQFATAFTLMARTLALPARLVVGFRAAGNPAEAVTRVRGGDVLVWSEVQFAGAGWVPFFPTPGPGNATSAVAPPTELVVVPAPPAPESPASPVPTSSATGGEESRDDADRAIENSDHSPAAAPPADAGGGPGTGLWVAVGLGALVGAYLALAFSGPALLRGVRSRGAPDVRIAGAYEQLVDELARSGPPMPAGATSGTLVEHARTHVGKYAAMSAAWVARAADGVAFGDVKATEVLAHDCERHTRLMRGHVHTVLAADRRARFADLFGRLRPGAVLRVLTIVRRTARRKADDGEEPGP